MDSLTNEFVYRSAKGNPVTNSLNVGKVFGRKHKNILRAIRDLLIKNIDARKWFYETTYTDMQGKEQPIIVMNRDGFTLLSMGFTGTKAIAIRVRLLQVFEKAENGEQEIAPMIHIRVFTNAQFGQLRAFIDEKGIAWFSISDICSMLNYSDASALINYRIKKGLISKADVIKEGATSLLFTNEKGVLALTNTTGMWTAKRESAEKANKWIMTVVKPALTGSKVDEPQQESLELEKIPTEALVASDLQSFNNPMFGTIRIVINEDGAPLFLAKDVCDILGYENARKAVADHVFGNDVTKRYTPTQNGTQLMSYVTESGLYSLIFGSKMEAAQKFTHWMTSEVIPSIRKHGVYLTPQAAEDIINNPDLIINLATQVKDARAKNKLLEAKNAELQQENEAKTLQLQKANELIEEQSEYVELGKSLDASPKDMSVKAFATQMAQPPLSIHLYGKLISLISCYRFFREDGWVCTSSNPEYKNTPTQKALDRHLLSSKLRPVENLNGELRPTTFVTPEGYKFFMNKFLKQQNAND